MFGKWRELSDVYHHPLYVHRWRVEKAHTLTKPQSDKLLALLCRTSGAIVEHPMWSGIVPPEADPGFDTLGAILIERPLLLLDVMDDPRDGDGMTDEGIFPAHILESAIRQTYEGEKPPEDLAIFADFFSVLRHGLYKQRLEAFTTLYCDSLLLRRDAVRAGCKELQYPQTCEVKGFPWKDYEPALAAPDPPPPPQEKSQASANEITLAPWKAAVAKYKEQQDNDATAKRMKVLIARAEDVKWTSIEAANPGRKIDRDIRTALSRDVPKLMKLYPDLRPFPKLPRN